MPVRSCASTPASFRLNVLYKVWVCRPGSAVSIFFKCCPTSFGSILPFRLSALALLMMVDLALLNCFCGCLLGPVALRAAFLHNGMGAEGNKLVGETLRNRTIIVNVVYKRAAHICTPRTF